MNYNSKLNIQLIDLENNILLRVIMELHNDYKLTLIYSVHTIHL